MMMDEEMEAEGSVHNEGSPQARPPPNLIGEINDLIEKERTLLELQLLDKNLEAEEWKRKYESLRLKVSEEETEEVKKILSLGDGGASEEAELQEPQQTATMKEIILNRLQGERVADLSNLKFASKASFASIIKALFGQKSAYPGLRVAWLRNCELSAVNAEAIAHLLRSAMLDAVDLSRNSLDDLSFIAIVEALKVTLCSTLPFPCCFSAELCPICFRIARTRHSTFCLTTIRLVDMQQHCYALCCSF